MIQTILKETLIPRTKYLGKIEKFLGKPVIKVLSGMRRVGKSSILKSVIQNLVTSEQYVSEDIFYLNKESYEWDHIRTYHDLMKLFLAFEKKVQHKKILVAIDEIQDIEEWERFVRSIFADRQEGIDIIITGSNSTLLSGELATFLTGRYVEFEIFPLDFEEYTLFRNEKATDALFMEYLRYGWLPGIIRMWRDEENIYEYLHGIYSTILLKDIVRHFGLRNVAFFEDLYRYLFSNIGSVFSAKSISDYLLSQKIKLSPETILTYLEYGQKAYLIHLTKAEDPATKKYFEIYNKYYVSDIGLRNSLIGWNPARDIGKVLENFVYLELIRAGYSVRIGRLKNGKEVDFVAEKWGIIKYFQVTYKLWEETTIEREYSALESLDDHWEKYVVSMDQMSFGVRNGIKHIHTTDLNTVL